MEYNKVTTNLSASLEGPPMVVKGSIPSTHNIEEKEKERERDDLKVRSCEERSKDSRRERESQREIIEHARERA